MFRSLQNSVTAYGREKSWLGDNIIFAVAVNNEITIITVISCANALEPELFGYGKYRNHGD